MTRAFALEIVPKISFRVLSPPPGTSSPSSPLPGIYEIFDPQGSSVPQGHSAPLPSPLSGICDPSRIYEIFDIWVPSAPPKKFSKDKLTVWERSLAITVWDRVTGCYTSSRPTIRRRRRRANRYNKKVLGVCNAIRNESV